jgi:hypothetical protein
MKTFKQMCDEMMTAADAGIPHDTKDAVFKKKKKPKVMTRHYIEVSGKRRRLTK